MSDVEVPGTLDPAGNVAAIANIEGRREFKILYEPAPCDESKNLKLPANFENDRTLHARNAYAIAMRVLARIERALGRRIGWSFFGHQLTIAPHVFLDLNAFYSKDDRAIFLGYYPGESGTVFMCLSHEVIGFVRDASDDPIHQRSTCHHHRPSTAARQAYHLPLQDFIDGVDVINALGSATASRLIALMHRIQTQIAGLALRIGLAPLADRHYRGPRLDVVQSPLTVTLALAQVVQMSDH